MCIKTLDGRCGIIFNFIGQIQSTFAWSLETTSNNEVEGYALFQSPSLAQESNYIQYFNL